MKISKIRNFSSSLIKHKSFQNFIIVSAIAFVQLGNNVILGRELPKKEFGMYSFIFLSVIRLFSFFLLFGQNAAILRTFSSKNIEQYRWKKYLLTLLMLIVIPVFISSFFVKTIYSLEWVWYYIMAAGILMMILVNITATIYRTRGNFNIAIFLERAHAIQFFIFIIISYLFVNKISLFLVSILKLSSFCIAIPFFIYLLLKLKEGEQKIGKSIITDGLVFWEMSLTVLVLINIDTLFIAKILSYEELALYSVILSVMQIYEFSRVSLFSVYSQKFSREKELNISNFFKIILAIIVITSLFYLFSTNFILKVLFKDKYTAPFMLIVLFCIYLSCHLLYVLPSCYILGKSTKKEMRIMLFFNLFAIIVKVILIFIFIDLGLSGFLLSGIISMGIRTGAGYYLVFNRRTLANPTNQ